MANDQTHEEKTDGQVSIIYNNGTLNPFQPGQSGNPSGRPKGSRSLTAIMNKLLDQQVNVDLDGQKFVITRREALMLNKLNLALTSPLDAIRLAAIKDIEDRLEGRPLPQMPASGGGEGEDVFVFYMPNQHSRKKPATDE